MIIKEKINQQKKKILKEKLAGIGNPTEMRLRWLDNLWKYGEGARARQLYRRLPRSELKRPKFPSWLDRKDLRYEEEQLGVTSLG